MSPRTENRGGARDGAGRRPGPQPHLRRPVKSLRRNRVMLNITDLDRDKLLHQHASSGIPIATLLYVMAKQGGL